MSADSRVTVLVGPVKNGILEQVSQFALVQRGSLTRFDEVALDHQIGVTVDLDLEPLAKLTRRIDSHSRFPVRCSGVKLGE
jgi:hypothetical protein